MYMENQIGVDSTDGMTVTRRLPMHWEWRALGSSVRRLGQPSAKIRVGFRK